MDFTQLLQMIMSRMPTGAQGPQGMPFQGTFPGQGMGIGGARPFGGVPPALPSVAQTRFGSPVGTGFGQPPGLAGLASGGYRPPMMGRGPYG